MITLRNIFHPIKILCFIVIISCQGNTKEQQSNANEEYDATKKQLTVDVLKYINDIPSPINVPYILVSSGAEFDERLINTIDSIYTYRINSSKTAVNLGIYAVDIGYLISYDRSEEALIYFAQCRELTSSLGISDAIDLELVKKFEKYLNNTDSLNSVINTLTNKINEMLGELEEIEMIALMIAGSWVESIYLSTSIISDYPAELPQEARTILLEPITRIIIEQKLSLVDILTILDDTPQTKYVKQMKSDLSAIKSIYDNQFAEVEKAIANNQGDYILEPSEIDKLYVEILKLRTKMVE